MIKKCFRLPYGDRNFCRLYLPYKDARKIPTIIYCHGWGNKFFGGGKIKKGAVKKVCELAVTNGFAFVSFDQYSEGKTGGKEKYFSYGRWGEGINNVYKFLIESGVSSNGNIGCFAISSGTTAAFRMEQKYQKLAFIVSVATAISDKIISKGGPMQFYRENKDLFDSGKTMKYAGKKVSKVFFEDYQTLCINNMDKVKCPTYFLQGASDNDRRKQDATCGYKLLKENGVYTEYMLVNGGGHGLNEQAELCAEETIKFAKKVFLINK